MKVKFSRCNSNSLTEVPQVDGQLIYVKDTHEIYIDVGTNRNKVSQYEIYDKLSSITNPNENKLYFIIDESKLYKYDKTEKEWIDLSGASKGYVDDKAEETLDAAKEYADKALDDFAPLKGFDSSFKTNGTTKQFFESVKAINPAVGSMFLGACILTDAPEGLENEEVKVEVYPNGVFHAVMTSTDIEPYEWTIQYWHGTEEWKPVANQAKEVVFDNTTTTGEIKATTVQEAIVEVDTKVEEVNTKIGIIDEALDKLNGEVI